jgi:hypothetical protein
MYDPDPTFKTPAFDLKIKSTNFFINQLKKIVIKMSLYYHSHDKNPPTLAVRNISYPAIKQNEEKKKLQNRMENNFLSNKQQLR